MPGKQADRKKPDNRTRFTPPLSTTMKLMSSSAKTAEKDGSMQAAVFSGIASSADQYLSPAFSWFATTTITALSG